MRLPIVAALAGAALVISGGSASAAVPDHGSFEVDSAFVDAEYCAAFGFAFDVIQHVVGDYTVLRDADGGFVKAIVHLDIRFTFSANGKTLTERDRITEIVTPHGERVIGLWSHVQGDSGLVLRDAGQLVFDGDGNLLAVRGPHPQFFGETFCAALAG